MVPSRGLPLLSGPTGRSHPLLLPIFSPRPALTARRNPPGDSVFTTATAVLLPGNRALQRVYIETRSLGSEPFWRSSESHRCRRGEREREEAVHRRRVPDFGPVSLSVRRGLNRGVPCCGLAAGALEFRRRGANTTVRPPNSVGRFVHCRNQGKNSSVEFAVIPATHRSFLFGGFVRVCAFEVSQGRSDFSSPLLIAVKPLRVVVGPLLCSSAGMGVASIFAIL